MLTPFFAAAMLAPARHATFRKVVVGHVLALTILLAWLLNAPTPANVTAAGYLLLVIGLVEGAALIGWRLTQMPKSPALEFLLTCPVQPRRLFLAEFLVGLSRFALVWLAGAPVLAALIFTGVLLPADAWVVLGMPFLWGSVAGIALTAWVYEPLGIRRLGELAAIVGVGLYLVIGVIAAENLLLWLHALPEWLGRAIFYSVKFAHEHNPFGVVRYWFDAERADSLAWQRLVSVNAAAGVFGVGAVVRASGRLVGHFHDRHYTPQFTGRADQSHAIGDRPLAWWAVKRVMEYSGRVNLYLAGGFSVIYAAYLVAGDHWPTWMGRLVFQLFENWGGAPVVALGLVVMATVPAVFQFGLWDATVQDRCRRLELLLLTDLATHDYWQASLQASWKRGRGYLLSAGILWGALGVSGAASWPAVALTVLGAGVMWALALAIGFRSFASGTQTSGLASLFTLGLPLMLWACLKLGWGGVAYLLPSGLAYLPLVEGVSAPAIGATLGYAGLAVVLARQGLATCEPRLRTWYDANQGLSTAG